MTRQTKVGLLIAVGLILLVSVIVSDYLSQAPQPVDLTRLWPAPAVEAPAPEPVAPRSDRVVIATPQELDGPRSSGPLVPVQPVAPSAAPPAPQANVFEPAPAPALVEQLQQGRQAATPSGTGYVVHYVDQGETLYAIAFRYYGNGEYWRSIAAANENVGPQGSVRQGQRLVIPNMANWVDEANAALVIRPEDRAPAARTAAAPAAASATAQPTLTRTAPATRVIEVKRGDTLSGLAATHLGSARRWQELFEANRDQLRTPESLRAGMKLRLPPAATASTGQSSAAQSARNTAPRPAAQTNTAARPTLTRTQTPVAASVSEGAIAYDRATRAESAARTYRVQRGDSLASIAQRELGSRDAWRELYEANRLRIENPDQLAVGQVLVLPR